MFHLETVLYLQLSIYSIFRILYKQLIRGHTNTQIEFSRAYAPAAESLIMWTGAPGLHATELQHSCNKPETGLA